MGDMDETGFPVETAKPKIFQVRVSRTPALGAASPHAATPLLCRDITGDAEHPGADAFPAGQGGHMDDNDHREHPQGAQGDQRRVRQGRAA